MRKLCFALAGAVLATPALALPQFLIARWYENGSHFCKYANGTVLNVGIKLCPLQIEG